MPRIKDKVVVITGANTGIRDATLNFARDKRTAHTREL